MSLRQLVEGDCGGVNPLMQLGGQFTRDAARKDEGYVQAQFERSLRPEDQLVNEYLGHMAAPPQSFQMDTLLQEMRDININAGASGSAGTMAQLNAAPMPRMIVDEVAGQWSKDFAMQNRPPVSNLIVHVQPQLQEMTHAQEFFDQPRYGASRFAQRTSLPYDPLSIVPTPLQNQTEHDDFFDFAVNNLPKASEGESVEDWINDYQNSKEEQEKTATNYNEKFWQRLQDEWQKMADENEHPWLSEYNESLELYKEYEFAEENPMSELENAFEKGKEYLAKGDVPSAVLCFEVACRKEPEKVEIWELLGMSQAENEMDPQSIAALKRALELEPNNQRVLMALAVCYTNEGLQNNAVKMLTNWLQVHPKYSQLLSQYPELQATTDTGGAAAMASSLIGGNRLQQLQNVYLDAVRMNPNEIDAEVQEVLGVLYNLSGEYDKAVDCFRAALHVNQNNAKVWNRLGASLANGSRSVEAVEAYQQALQLEPGFIRVRYNVGVCCMNLKAYQQAVEHLLTALTMQANTAARREVPTAAAVAGKGQQMSESIWSTLKMVVSLMGRSDLQGYVADRNLTALNEAFKD